MTAGRNNAASQSVHWCTPPKYVKAVKEMFRGSIALDPCSNQWSVVKADTEWALPEIDGLAREWDFEAIYVNPPYGADRARGTTIKDWLGKCAHAFRRYDAEVLALVPVAVNTGHWKKHVWGEAAAVCFLYDTRLKFLENGSSDGKGAPMACAMVYWGARQEAFFDVFIRFGAVVDLRSLQGEIIGEAPRPLQWAFRENEGGELAAAEIIPLRNP